MSGHPVQLLILHADDRVRSALSEPTSARCVCSFVDDWPALARAVRRAQPSAVIVVDPYACSRHSLAVELRNLIVSFPSRAVFAVLEIAKASPGDLVVLAKWGVAEIVGIGIDDTVPALLHRARSARTRSLCALLQRVVPQDLPERVRLILFAAAHCAPGRATADDVAAHLDVCSRTLARWCVQAALPPPQEILAALRVLIAAELLNDPYRTIRSIASDLGYGSEAGLRRATLELAGLTPTELRNNDAVATAVGAVCARLGMAPTSGDGLTPGPASRCPDTTTPPQARW